MFKILGRLTASHPWLVCGAWLVAGALLSAVAPAWDSKAQDDDICFLPARCPSVRGYQLLEKAFPLDIFASRVIFAVERADQPLTEADFALVDAFVRDLTQLRQEEPGLKIGGIASYRDGLIGNRLRSADGRCTLIQVSLGTPFLALQTRATVDRTEARLQETLANRGGPNPPRLLTTGAAGIGRDLIRASGESLEGTTVATVVLVIVVLLFVYRAPLLALVPLATIAVSVWVSLQLLALLTRVPGVHLVNVARVFAIVMLYGAGTDYCLFLISRYREELADGQGAYQAVVRSVGTVGGALAASAGTVICGLGMMGFAEFAKVRCAGPAIALSLGVALLASLTLAPALLCVFGRFVFWPGQERAHAKAQRRQERPLSAFAPLRELFTGQLWERISRVVVARPVLVWSLAVLVLMPLAALGLRVVPNYKPTGELSPTSDSVQGVAAIQRHFRAGEIGPLTVLLTADTDWATPQGREVIAHLSRGFGYLPNVAEVRSLTQPLGTPLQEPVAPAARDGFFGGLLKTALRRDLNRVLEKADAAARDFYLATLTEDGRPRYVTRLDVVLKSDPFDAASAATLDQIQIWLNDVMPQTVQDLGHVRPECYGVTVSSRDLAEVTEADRARVNLLVMGGIFCILLLVVHSPWLAAYLLGSVLFSYFATLGATALVSTYWTGRPLGQVDWRVPFFLFTILVAVGEDYNIFLISRVLLEKQRHGEEEGTRRALAHTGGTITSCGLIMAGTFATLMLAGLGTLVQIGFALAFGVLLDTFLVRPILVPAFTLVVWRLTGKADGDARPSGVPVAGRVPVQLPKAG
jgi:RND superfamily putative drug exporter